uniref:Mitochondria-eating protein n=1 Tax=Magallana gigas TaxID=29159 RepID=A0A8W8KUD0_MAGGI
MGNASSSKAVNPSKDTDKKTQYLKQNAQEGNTSCEKFAINQQRQKWIEVKSKEQSRSNGIEETIRCPDNMDDQAFDDFARECTEATFEIPSSWTKITMKQLSKIAGSKLTSNNPDIADLNDDNRPTKLAEKFGQLYDDAWTDSMEELTGVETRLDDRAAISILLRIVMTAYQFCSDSRSMFLDLTDCQTIMTCKDTGGMKDITKLPDALTPDIQQAIKLCLRTEGTTLISETKETITLSQFVKTAHFAERCVELCWFMQTTQPPIHLSAHIPDDGMMDADIFKAYMKSGTEIDYIVWPVMHLYENGPVLNKGIAQPK